MLLLIDSVSVMVSRLCGDESLVPLSESWVSPWEKEYDL